MAYQLIYTSAPRALEAGRSGFGTVARHREISSQLVAVLERVSQFSRLPGSNIHRVIFSHRIITLAGVRHHVLSSIRDAGADYTGRTNHIAHHLVVSSREIAQLGASCPSPAEILTSMPWATSWLEVPRFLGSDEEVSLAAFPPGQSTGAWAALTGNPNHARILVTGEAARGAYLVHPAHADLLRLFDESLQLSPDRLWQIAFTTSLQPSDEVSDFRWIGIESDSPLRNQAEGAGRIAFNLGAPSSLPHVEYAPAIPSPATSTTVPVQSAPNTPVGINLVPELHGTTPSSFPQQSVLRTAPHTTTHHASGGIAQKAAPTSGKLNLFWPALVAFLLVGLGIFQFQRKENQELEKIDASLKPLDTDYPKISSALREQINDKNLRGNIKEMASLINNLCQNSLLKKFDTADFIEKFDGFKRSAEKNFNVPPQANEIIEIFKELNKISEESNLIKSEDTQDRLEKPKKLLKTVKQRLETLHNKPETTKKLLEGNPFKAIRNDIISQTKEYIEHEVLGLLEKSQKPSENSTDFRDLFPSKPTEPQKLLIDSDRVNKILDTWEKSEEYQKNQKASTREELKTLSQNAETKLPDWLIKVIEEQLKSAPAPPPTPVQAPVAATPSIPESRKPTEYYLNISSWTKNKRLLIPELKESGTLSIEGKEFKHVRGLGFIENVTSTDTKFKIDADNSNQNSNSSYLVISDPSVSKNKRDFKLEYILNGKIDLIVFVKGSSTDKKPQEAFDVSENKMRISDSLKSLHHGHVLYFRFEDKDYHQEGLNCSEFLIQHKDTESNKIQSGLNELKHEADAIRKKITEIGNKIDERLSPPRLSVKEKIDINSDLIGNKKASRALFKENTSHSRFKNITDFSTISEWVDEVNAFLNHPLNSSLRILTRDDPPTKKLLHDWCDSCKKLNQKLSSISEAQLLSDQTSEKSKNAELRLNNGMIPGKYTIFAQSRFGREFDPVELYRVVVQEPTASPVAPPPKP